MKADLFATDGGIGFGYAVAKPALPLPGGIERYPLRYVGDRHIITYAPSGAGKSRRLLLSNILQLTNWSLLILDIKGELAQLTRNYRAQIAGNEVVLLNPFGVLDMPSNGYNPVAALDPTSPDFIDDAMGLAEALIRIEGPDSHWGSSAQDLLCALIIYSRLTGRDGGSLGHVRALLGKPANQFVEMALDMIEVGIRQDIEELGIKAGRFCDLTPDNKELNSIISTASTQTRWLDSRPMKADLARGSFDFERMKREKITAYINLPANRLGSHSSYLRVVLTAFLQSMLRNVRESQVPVLVMLDEAAQIGELPILRDSIALLRGYGVKVWSLYQDVPQHKAVLGGGDRHESAAANSGVLLAMAPQDMTTADMLSRRSGQTTANVLGYSAPAAAFRGEPADSSISLTAAAVPGIQPIELMQMDEGFAVMFSHKTKGHVFGYVPDPSEVESFDRILRGSNRV